MDELTARKRFAETGRVEDYLRYARQTHAGPAAESAAAAMSVSQETDQYADHHNGDRASGTGT